MDLGCNAGCHDLCDLMLVSLQKLQVSDTVPGRFRTQLRRCRRSLRQQVLLSQCARKLCQLLSSESAPPPEEFVDDLSGREAQLGNVVRRSEPQSCNNSRCRRSSESDLCNNVRLLSPDAAAQQQQPPPQQQQQQQQQETERSSRLRSYVLVPEQYEPVTWRPAGRKRRLSQSPPVAKRRRWRHRSPGREASWVNCQRLLCL